ncbi:MAG: MFS transporter, partial [Hydrotalea sp.]|nr:MFS transporter [Hydrotalea sp.]
MMAIRNFFHTMKGDLGTQQGDVGRLLLAIFIDGFMVGMILTHIPLTLKYDGESSRVIGWVLGATSLAALFASPWVGATAQKFGMARAVIIAGLLNAVIIILMSLSREPLYWGVLRFFAGFLVVMRWLGMEAWTNSLALPQNRGRIMTLYTASFTSSVALGSGLIGHIFLLGFLPYGIMAGLLLLSAWPILKMKHKTIRVEKKQKLKMGIWLAVKTNPVVLIIAVASGVMFGASGMIAVQTINHGFTPTQASFVVFLYFVGPIIFFPLVSHLVNEVPAKKLIPVAGILAAAFAWPALYTKHLHVIEIFIMLYGAMELIIYSSLLGFIGHHYRGQHLVAMNSLVVMVYNATSTVTAPLAGEVMAELGLIGLPLIMMMVGLLAISV